MQGEVRELREGAYHSRQEVLPEGLEIDFRAG